MKNIAHSRAGRSGRPEVGVVVKGKNRKSWLGIYLGRQDQI